MDDVYELVMMARSDNKLWKSGLDSSYKTFIANKPSPNMKAVLLSILWTDICDIKWTLQWQCVISVQLPNCSNWANEQISILQPFLLPTTFPITYQLYQSTNNSENFLPKKYCFLSYQIIPTRRWLYFGSLLPSSSVLNLLSVLFNQLCDLKIKSQFHFGSHSDDIISLLLPTISHLTSWQDNWSIQRYSLNRWLRFSFVSSIYFVNRQNFE